MAAEIAILTCMAYAVFWFVCVFVAWLDGKLTAGTVRAWATELTATSLDVISPFRCSGCDGMFLRGQLGHQRVGEGFEFCSQDCRDNPLPFPAAGDDRMVN